MADNNSVLGQESITPDESIKPTMSGLSEDLTTKKQRLNEINKTLSSDEQARSFSLPENISYRQFNKRLGEYSAVEGVDIPESMAQAQSGFEQIAWDLPSRALSKAAVEVLKLPGFIVGGAELALKGFDSKEYGDAFNNGWNVALDTFNKNLQDNALPVYTPETVQNGDIWDKLKSTSFWASEGADGVGFLVGMMAPGAILRWAKLGEGVAKMFSAAEKLSKPADALLSGLQIEKMAASAAKAAKINDYTAAIINTGFEALTEGQQAFNEYLEQNPNDIEGAGKVGRDVFMLNNAILIGPNILNQKWLFNGFKRAEGAVKSAGKEGIAKALDKTITEAGEIATLKAPSLGKKVWDISKVLGKGVVSEGFFEEGLQYTVAEGAKKGVNIYNLEDVLNEYVDNITADTKGNTEMWSGIVLGGILGGGMSMYGGIQEQKQVNKLASEYNKVLSNNWLNYLKTYKDFAKKDESGKPIFKDGQYELDPDKVIKGGEQALKTAYLREMAKTAFEEGNKEGYENVMNLIHFDYMLPWLQIEGGLDLLKRHIKSVAKKENENDLKSLGIETKQVSEIEKELIGKADKFQELWNKVNDTHDLNFKIRPIEGSTKQDIKDFSDIVKHSKLSSKVTMDFKESRINALSEELASLGVSTTSEKFNKDYVKELKKSYEDLKASGNVDKVKQLDIEKKIDSIDKSIKAYLKADEELKDAYDNTKNQKAFVDYLKEKKAANEKANVAKQTASEEKKAKKEYIKDPDLQQLYNDTVKIEKFDNINKTFKVWDEESQSVVEQPGRARVVTTRGLVKVTYKDSDNKEHSIIAAVGEGNLGGGLDLRLVEKDGTGRYKAISGNSIAYLNSKDELAIRLDPKSNKITKIKGIKIELFKSPEELQMERQIEAFKAYYNERLESFKSTMVAKEEILKASQQIKDLKSELKTLMREHRKDLLVAKRIEDGTIKLNKEETKRVMSIYKTVSKLQDKITEKEDSLNKLKEHNIRNKKAISDFRKEIKDLKDSEQLPFKQVEEIIASNEEMVLSESKFITSTEASIANTKDLIRNTLIKMRIYRSQLAKALGMDITDSALGTKGMPSDEKNEIIDRLLLQKINEIMTTPYSSFEDMENSLGSAGIDFNKAYSLSLKLQEVKEWLDSYEDMLQVQEANLKRHEELRDESEKELKQYKSRYQAIFRNYKKLIPSYFKEKDFYSKSLIHGKLLEGENIIDMEMFYPDIYELANWEIDARHPFEDFDSFLTITSNQEHADKNPDVMRWFVFVNNFAYKGIESERRTEPKYALKTFTYKQIEESDNKDLKSKIKFYLGNGEYMTYDEISKISDKDQKKKAIDKAKEDIKAIVVNFKDTNKISLFTEEGTEEDKFNKGTTPVYSSIGLGTELYKESGYERFSSKQWKLNWMKEKLKENPEIEKEELESLAQAMYEGEFEEAKAEFLKFRERLDIGSEVLSITGINRGVKLDTDVESDLYDTALDELDYGNLKFYTSTPIVDKETGEYKKETIEINGNTYELTSGFTYWLKGNNLEVVKPKTLGETGSHESIFNIFKAIAQSKENSEAARSYLEQALHMLYSSINDTSKPHRLFFHMARDKNGEVISGKYDYIVYGDRTISISDLAEDKNTDSFKEFLKDKYWNFDKRLIDNNIKDFIEWRVDKNGNLYDVTWKAYGGRDEKGKEKSGPGIGGYQAFLFQPNDKGDYVNIPKGKVNLAPAVKQKGKDKFKLAVLKPQYINQSLRTTVRVEKKKEEPKDKKDTSGVSVPEGVGLFKVIIHNNNTEGHIAYVKDADRLDLNTRKKDNIILQNKAILSVKDETEKKVAIYIKTKIKEGKVSDLKEHKVPGTNYIITVNEVNNTVNESKPTTSKVFEKLKEEKEVVVKEVIKLNKTFDELWDNKAITEDQKNSALTEARKLIPEASEDVIKNKAKEILHERITKPEFVDPSYAEIEEEDENEPPFARMAEAQDYVLEGKDKIEWFKQKFPNFPIELIPRLVDGDKFGKFIKGSKVLISSLAEEGTTYHESFHVWNILFNENRQGLYDETRKRLDNPKMTDREAEEFLAEEFRDYMLIGSSYKFNKGEELKKSFFQKILDFIKSIFGIDVLNTDKGAIEEAFKTIEKGTFTTPIMKSKESFARKIPGISASKKLAYLKDINYRFFSLLLKDVTEDGDLIFNLEQTGHELYEKVFMSYKDERSRYNIAGKTIPTFVEDILNNEKDFIANHRLYLTKYNINLSHTLLEDDVDEDETSRNKAEWIESYQVSLKDAMPTPIRLLIASLKEVDEKGNAKTDAEFYTQSNVEYDRIVNLLHNNLSKITTPEGMMNKLKYLSKRNPSLRMLYRQLGGGISADQMSKTKFKLYEQFITSFSSNKMEALVATNNNDGTITKADMVDESRKEVIKAQWIDNAKTGKAKYISIKNNEFILNKESLLADINNKVNPVKVLSRLGIYVPEEMFNNKAVRNYIKTLGSSLDIAIKKKDEITLNDLYDRNRVENQKELDNLAKEVKDYTENDSDLMYYNIDGHMEWSITRSSHLSDIVNKLNEYSDQVRFAKRNEEPIPEVPESLYKLMPFNFTTGKGNLFNGGSEYWNHISNGERIKLVTLKGLRSQMGDGADVSKLTAADYYAMSFDYVLNNIIPFRRSADRRVEYGFYTNPSNSTIGPSTFAASLNKYLYDEVITSIALLIEDKYNKINKTNSTQFGSGLKNYSRNARTLRTFDFIYNNKFNEGYKIQSLEKFIDSLPDDEINIDNIRDLADSYIAKNDKAISVAFNNFIKQSTEANKQALLKNKIIKKVGDRWSIPGLNPSTLKELDLARTIDNNGLISNDALNQILLLHSYNFFNGVQEQHKMFIGDMASYDNMKSSNKRTTSSASTREKTPNDDKTITLLNTQLPKITGLQHTKTIKQVVINQIYDSASEELQKISKDYKDMSVTDGSVLCTLDFMRGIYGRRGKWTDEMERTYQYEMQSLVYKILNSYELSKLAPWASSKMFTDPNGIFFQHSNGFIDGKPRFNGKIINPLGDEMGELPPMKTQGSGFIANDINIGAMIIDKMSVEPMIPSLLKDNELKFMLSMISNDIDSVGDESTKKSDSYVNQGSIKDGYRISNDTKVTEISYDDYGFQFDIEDKEGKKVTDSTQKICVYTNNMYDRGKILPEYAEIEDLVKERDNLLNEYYQKTTKKAIDELGLKESDENFYSISDINKFKNVLKNLFVQRQLPDNIIEGLDLVMDSDTKLFDLFSDGNKVEQVLLAFVRNNVLKRKVNGSMLVQAPSYIYSEDLKFYTVSDGTIQKSEVMIPAPKAWNKWIEHIGGIDKLNELLESGKLDKKITEFTANRIPTADINTIEIFRVKKFLPSYVGARIVLPKEIVAKTSSDFDIDKLTSYFNNLKVDNKKGPSYIAYESGKDNSIEQIENRINEIHEEVLTHPKRFKYLVRPHSSSYLKDLAKTVKKPEDYISKLVNEHGNEFWLSTQWWYNNMKAESFWGGKQVLSLSASGNTVHSLETRYPIEIINPKYKGIFFFKNKVDETGTSGLREDADGRDISDNHSQIMVAAVDVAKDDFINELNINNSTLGVVLMLQKYAGVSMKSIGKMLTHPVVDEYLREMQIANSQIMRHNQYTFMDKNWYYEEIGTRQNIVKKILGISDTEYEYLMSADSKYYNSTKNKYKDLTDEDFNKNDKKTRIQILDNFLMYSELAWKVNGLNSVLRPYAASRFGKSLNSVESKIEKLNDIIDSKIFSPADITEHINNTFLSGALSTYDETIAMYGWMSLTTKYPKIHRLLNEKIFSQFKIRKPEEYDKAVQAVKNEFLSFIFTFYNEDENIANRYKELFIGENSLPVRLKNIKGKISNEALNALIPSINEFSKELGRKRENNYLRPIDKKMDISDQNLYTAAIEELFNNKDKEVQQFAQDFFEFVIYQSSMNNSPIGITKLLPNTVFVPMMDRIVDYFIKKHEKDFERYINSFSHQFFRNNLHDSNVVYRFDKTLSDGGKDIDIAKVHKFISNVHKNSRAARNEYIAVRYYKTSGLERSKDRRFDRKSPIEYLLYRRTGKQIGYNMQYELVEKLGDGMRFKEYYPVKNGSEVQSILTTNRYEGVIKPKTSLKKVTNHSMFYKMPAGDNLTKKDTSTLDLVEKGVRIATTRSYKLGEIGDIITFENRPQKYIITGIEQLTKEKIEDLNWIKQWSQKEQWTESYFKRVKGSNGIKVGNYQTSFKKINDTNNTLINKSNDDLSILKSKLYQLDEVEQGEPIEELDNIVKDYLNAIGVTYKSVDVIKDHTGTKVPAVAIAKLTEMTLEVIEGKRNIKTLPEEAAHFYVSLLNENDPLYKVMFNNIINYSEYQDVVKTYTERYNGDEKLLRHEAIGKVIANRMINGISTQLSERQRSQVNTWWSRLWSHIKKLLLMSKTDPYAKAAYDILTKNINSYNNSSETIMEESKKLSPEEKWNELPFTAKGIYKYDYRRNLTEAELAYDGYISEFGEENVMFLPSSDPNYKAKIAIKKPKNIDIINEIIKKEDASIQNMKELTKAPVEFKAEQLTMNFDYYFEEDSYLETEEKAAQMRAIENGDMEISCNFN